MNSIQPVQATTILCVQHNGEVAIAGDGQVTMGDVIVKRSANKIRKLYNSEILAGFAGSAADAFTLFESFEGRLEMYKGNLLRASVELAKYWRGDKVLRRLEALLIVCDKKHALTISGSGDVIESDEKAIGIGSGGSYALAAAIGMLKHSKLSALEIAEESVLVASNICIYTNSCIVSEKL